MVRISERLRSWRGHACTTAASAGLVADAALIGASGRFDSAWYLAAYPDVAKAQFDPIEHYLAFGAGEGRNPSADFDTRCYRAAQPNLPVGVNPLVHAIVDEAERTP